MITLTRIQSEIELAERRHTSVTVLLKDGSVVRSVTQNLEQVSAYEFSGNCGGVAVTFHINEVKDIVS